MSSPSGPTRITVVLFWLAVAFVYFWNLGGGSLEFWDEALTAERSREFFLTGDWLTPHSSLAPVFNKPPVYYWLTALNFSLMGESEYSVRLWSVLFGIGCLMFVCLIGRKATGNEWGGLLAAGFLATNPHWINYTRNGMLDSGLMFGMLAGIYFLVRSRTAAGLVLSGAAFAFGCLIKNPLALVGLAAPAVELGFVERDRSWLRRIGVAAAIAILLSSVWYGLEYLRWGRAYLDQFVGYNMVQRFNRPIEGQGAGPFFYLETWWGGSAVSLVLFVLPLAFFLVRKPSVLRPLLPYLAILVAFLLLLSFSASKRGIYLLLIYPFAAIVSGGLWIGILDSVKTPGWRNRVIGFLMIVSVVYLGVRYKPCIQGHASLKEVAIQLRSRVGTNAVVYSFGIPSDPVMFYSHVLTRAVWTEPSREDMKPVTDGIFSGTYLLVRQKQKEQVLKALGAAGSAKVICQNSDYIILLPDRL